MLALVTSVIGTVAVGTVSPLQSVRRFILKRTIARINKRATSRLELAMLSYVLNVLLWYR